MNKVIALLAVIIAFSMVTVASAHETGKPHSHKKHAKKAKHKKAKKMDDAAAAPAAPATPAAEAPKQ